MIHATRTSTALLEGLFSLEDEAVWSEFDRRYRPIIIGFARRLGLSDADAADVAQETMTQFIREYSAGRYKRERARLRTWLIAMAKSRIAGVRRKQGARREFRGESAYDGLPDTPELEGIWDAERRSHLLNEAMEKLREKTRTSDSVIEAFQLFVINQMPAEAVAAQLDISVQDVYNAKSRVAQRLRSILDELDTLYDDEL